MQSVFVPCKVYSLNQDAQRGHYMQRARLQKTIRQSAKLTAVGELVNGRLIPVGDPVQILVEPHECRQRLTDVGNCLASAKAAIDGLVDAGLLEDDSPRYVKALTFLVGKRVHERDEGLLIMLRGWA